MVKRIILCGMAFVLFLGCTKGEVKDELKLLLDNPGTARGSDLMLALCGWPTHARMRALSLEVELSPGSGRTTGEGTADISATYRSFSCRAKIGFSYGRAFVGGHGLGGGNEIQLSQFRRENPVPAAIGDPSGARRVQIGTLIRGRLAQKSGRLPDGSLADYYFIDLETRHPLLHFELEGERGLNPGGYVYQDCRPAGTFICNMKGATLPKHWNVIPLKRGRAVILVTAREKDGAYSLLIEEPDDGVRSLLRLTEEYRRKAR